MAAPRAQHHKRCVGGTWQSPFVEGALLAVQDIKIDPMNGIPFLPDAWQVKHVEKGAPIAIAAHSGPWHLRQTIRGSAHHTTDMDEADIIYVYDHCYYMRWLAQVLHSLPRALLGHARVTRRFPGKHPPCQKQAQA